MDILNFAIFGWIQTLHLVERQLWNILLSSLSMSICCFPSDSVFLRFVHVPIATACVCRVSVTATSSGSPPSPWGSLPQHLKWPGYRALYRHAAYCTFCWLACCTNSVLGGLSHFQFLITAIVTLWTLFLTACLISRYNALYLWSVEVLQSPKLTTITTMAMGTLDVAKTDIWWWWWAGVVNFFGAGDGVSNGDGVSVQRQQRWKMQE